MVPSVRLAPQPFVATAKQALRGRAKTGWQVWKSEDGRSLNAPFAEAVGSLDDLFLDNEQVQSGT
jgi:hypothetical protein